MIMEHTRRRPLLGGIATTAAVGIRAACASSSASFNSALGGFEHANAHFLQLCRRPARDEEVNASCQATERAYQDLIATPAPDFRTVSAKLDAIVARRDDSPIPEGEIEMVAQDMRRLVAGRAR